MNILDPFEEEERDTFKVHLSVMQRNARQRITIMSGLPEEFDLKKINKSLKQSLCCSGSIQENVDGKYLKLSGDQRDAIAKFLVEQEIAEKEQIVIHGC